MDTYLCYYCGGHFNEFEKLIQHLCDAHRRKELKYREYELNESTGKFGYRTKLFPDVVPCLKEIHTTNDNAISISNSKKSKRQKISNETEREILGSDKECVKSIDEQITYNKNNDEERQA